MTMPAFTAEASLYKTSWHYRTGRHTVNTSPRMLSPVWPALREQEGEIIHVHGCPPGFRDIGGSCWPIPLTEPPIGGGGGGLPSGGGPSDGGGGSGEPPRPPKPKPGIETLGQGPYRSQLLNVGFECLGGIGPVDIQECHKCSSIPRAGRRCTCYTCQVSSDLCTPFYDCTGQY
jgi:hypothetical protein